MLRAVAKSAASVINVTAVPFAPDTVSTNGNGTLSGANIINGVRRTGLSDGAADQMPSATAIVAAVTSPVVNQTWSFVYTNTTGFPVTLTAGAGTTFSQTSGGSTDLIPAANQVVYQIKITNVGTPAVTVLREWSLVAGS